MSLIDEAKVELGDCAVDLVSLLLEHIQKIRQCGVRVVTQLFCHSRVPPLALRTALRRLLVPHLRGWSWWTLLPM